MNIQQSSTDDIASTSALSDIDIKQDDEIEIGPTKLQRPDVYSKWLSARPEPSDISEYSVSEYDKMRPSDSSECSANINDDPTILYSDVPYFSCHLCDTELLTEQSRIQHLERRHGVFNGSVTTKPRRFGKQDGQPSKCDICGKEFKFPCLLKYHKAQSHSDLKPYKCHICSDGFPTKQRLKNHVKKHSDDRPHTCDICNKSFKSTANLNNHRKVVHTSEKPFTCNVCFTTFAYCHNLEGHMEIHANEDPHDCKLCGRKFLSNSSLMSHSRVHK